MSAKVRVEAKVNGKWRAVASRDIDRANRSRQ